MKNIELSSYKDHGISGYGIEAKLSSAEPLGQDMLQELAENLMLTIASRCTELGAKCIGHIKSYIESEKGTIKADTIGQAHGSFSSGELSGPVYEFSMTINSIVQGISEEDIKKTTVQCLQEIARQWQLTLSKDKERAFFDHFNFSNQDL